MTTAREAPAVDTVMLSIGGLRIATQTTGSGDPVLLLNGMSRPMASWTHYARLLEGRRIITFDSPGVGASATPFVPYSMRKMADITVRVLDAVGVGRADIVGFSHGGAIAQQIAIKRPDRVNRLVLMSTSCGLGAVPGRGSDAKRILMTPLSEARDTSWGEPQPLGVLWQVVAFSTWTSIPRLGDIDAPTLVITGDNDKAVPPVNSKLLAERIHGARLEIVRAGHDLQKPKPAAVVAELIQEFFASTPSRLP